MNAKRNHPSPPKGLDAAGRKLWRAITEDYDLATHELQVLTEAARTVDLLDELEKLVQRDGPTVPGLHGEKINPAAIEARQQRITLARLLVALRIPVDEGSAAGRTQVRGGVRGVYGVRPA